MCLAIGKLYTVVCHSLCLIELQKIVFRAELNIPITGYIHNVCQ